MASSTGLAAAALIRTKQEHRSGQMSTLLLRLTETLKTDLAEIWTYLALERGDRVARHCGLQSGS
jgi:hypothetical protein